MPTYDYRCLSNNQIIEVNHRMSEQLSTWGELCERVGIELGTTPASAPIEKLATGGNIISSSNRGSGASPAPSCSTGLCGTGMCGLN